MYAATDCCAKKKKRKPLHPLARITEAQTKNLHLKNTTKREACQMYELNLLVSRLHGTLAMKVKTRSAAYATRASDTTKSCILIYAEPCSDAANAARCVMMNTLWTQTTRMRSLQSRVHMFGNMLKIWRW